MKAVNFDDIAVLLRYEGPKMAADFQHNILYLWYRDTEGDENYGSIWLVYDLSSTPDTFYAFFQGTASLHDLEIKGKICFGRLEVGRKTLNIDDSFAFAWESASIDEDYTAITDAYTPQISRMGDRLQFSCIEYGTVWQAFNIKINDRYPHEADFTDIGWSSFAKNLAAYWSDIYLRQTGYVILDEELMFSSPSSAFTSMDSDIAKLDYTQLPYKNIYFAREGDAIRIQHCSEIWWLPTNTFHELISRLIDAIANNHADLREYEPARLILENRAPCMDVQDEIKTATGLDLESTPTAYQLLETVIRHSPRSRTLLAAARMGFENLGDPDITQLLRQIEAYPVSPRTAENSTLRKICSRVPGKVRNSNLKNFMQGYYLASYLREYMKMTKMEPLDVDALVSKLGLEVVSDNFSGNILALAIWDSGSPRIHLNMAILDGKESLRRSSICHELCHILIDRQGARPLCDLLVENETTDGVERRARAFAAELLLPRAWAVSFLSGLDDKADIDRLALHFGVGKELAANQIIDADKTKIIPVPAISLETAKKVKMELSQRRI